MQKVKIILGYLNGFIITILLSILSLLLIVKYTLYDENYIKNTLNKNNYYTNVYNDTYEDMKDYMVSSGLPDTILEDIFTLDEITKDINEFINNIYNGKITDLNTDFIKERLEKNIDEYLTQNNIAVTNESDLESFNDEITNIYKNQVCLYKTLNSFINIINKIGNKLDKIIIILALILIIFTTVTFIFIKINYFGSLFISSGLILLFIRLLIFEKIDIQNILVISENFSIILKNILNNYGDLLLKISIFEIIIGFIISLIVYFTEKK